MNAPRHDPDELKAALDAFAAAQREDERLQAAREDALRKHYAHGLVLRRAREKAAELLKREGGSVVHNDQFWKTDGQAVTHEPVKVNLDALDELRLTEPPSEKAA